MIQADPRAIIYAQLYTGMAFIGRLPMSWQGNETVLKLVDALQLVNIQVPIPTPQGININIRPALIPVHHLSQGPEDHEIMGDLIMRTIECDEKHPLVMQYIQTTSRIQMVPAGTQIQDPAPRPRPR